MKALLGLLTVCSVSLIQACGVNPGMNEMEMQSEVKPMPKENASSGKKAADDSQDPQQVSFVESGDPLVERFQKAEAANLSSASLDGKSKFQCMFRLDQCSNDSRSEGRFAVVGNPRSISDFSQQCEVAIKQFLTRKCGEEFKYSHVIFAVDAK